MTNERLTAWPDQATMVALLQEHAAGSGTAFADLTRLVLDPLAAFLSRLHSNLDPHLWYTAAEDALLGLYSHPERYDAARGTFESYLKRSARGDLLNALGSEQRRRARELHTDNVELLDAARNQGRADVDDPAERYEAKETRAEQRRLIAQLIPPQVYAGLTDGERKAMALLRDGERRTDRYAEVLDIMHLPPEQRRKAVKRVKDKLKKRIERTGGGHDTPN